VHLGARACRIGLLLDFLRTTECRTLYLVGDIVDIESLRRSFYWPTSHTEALQLILQKSRDGTRVIYIPGNHDDDMRSLCGVTFGNIEIRHKAIHTTRSGRRLLVLHGDEFDNLIKCGSLAERIGSAAYRGLIVLNRCVHWAREMLGRPYWSLAQHVKMRVGNAMRYVDEFQRACIHAAKEAGVDGVICGHIHQAALIEQDGVLYCNDGDWVESCTALTEDEHGALALVVCSQPAAEVTPLEMPLREVA
jgi:UDP-2,3-diacylglucosamine pyrophosphatase LpxH